MNREAGRERYTMQELAAAHAVLDAREHHQTLNAHELGRILRRYGIRPQTIRFGGRTARGYYRHQFDDAFARDTEDAR